MDGYVTLCKTIVTDRSQIQDGIVTAFPELQVLGHPLASVLAFTSKDPKALNIYSVGDAMSKRGWSLNALVPAALHIACTRLTIPVVDEFLSDLRSAVDEVLASGANGKGDLVALYGEFTRFAPHTSPLDAD